MTDDDPRILAFRMGDGSEWQLEGWAAATRWLKELATFWSWLLDYRGRDPANVIGNASHRCQQLIDRAETLKSNGESPSSLAPSIAELLGDAYAPVHPRSDRGVLLESIRQAAGDEATIFAFSILSRLVNVNQIQTMSELRGANLAASPEILQVSDGAARLQAERKRFREAISRFETEAERLTNTRERAWQENLKAADATARSWHRSRVRRWLRYAKSARDHQTDAISSIKAVEAAYKEKMGLAAPVEYWEAKAEEHQKAEHWMRAAVIAFFPAALAGLALAFNQTALSLIKMASVAQEPGAPPFPTAVFIIASAGLASCAGLVFWVGRLLTKLHLSQHHLRQDARERATMTKTYLALIENGAASAEERQIILNALFRNTSDGIVREEGGLDPSIAAALGKFLARP